MKKLALIVVALVMLLALLMPTGMIAQTGTDAPPEVSADLPEVIAELPSYCEEEDISRGCCQYSECSCCLELCCECLIFWFKVGYFNENHDWTQQYVKAHNGDEAADLIGLRAGYNCFVVRALSYHGTT